MQELSMNILDIAQNSVRAEASLIEIQLLQNSQSKLQTLVIQDNGCGMDEEMVARVTDPFCTSRTTRKVGLGLPFLKMAAEMTGGSLLLQSQINKGTTVTATFTMGHIDLAPVGDMGATLSALVGANPDIDFVYTYRYDEREFVFDTRQAREILGDVSLSEPAVAVFIRDHVNEGMNELVAGAGENL